MGPDVTRCLHACAVCAGEIYIVREYVPNAEVPYLVVHPECLRDLKRPPPVGPEWHHGASQVPVILGIAEGEEGENYRVTARVGRAPAVEASIQKADITTADYAPCGAAWPRLGDIMGERP